MEEQLKGAVFTLMVGLVVAFVCIIYQADKMGSLEDRITQLERSIQSEK